MAAMGGMKKNRFSALPRGLAPTLIAWIIAATGLVATAFAHDDVRGRPHFKGPPASPTAVMRAVEAGTQSAQSLANLSNVTCAGGFADIYPCQNIDLLAFVPLADMESGGALGGANDIWGWSWTDQTSTREFALVGLKDGTAFVEITDPVNPVYLGKLPTHTGASTWRDIKVYADYAFIVSQASGHGMQVFDLTRLLTADPNTAPHGFTDDAQYSGFGNAHNIVINEDTAVAYAVGTDTCSGGLHMIYIFDPLNPTFAGCFSGDGYTHDAQCVIYRGPDAEHWDKEICLNSNEDTLTIVDVTDKAAPVQLSRTPYPGDGYTHQAWLTPDHAYLLLGDELDELDFGHNTRTRIFDVSNLEVPFVTSSYDSTVAAIDHNQYVKGNFAYQANYRAGLRVLEIIDGTVPQLSEVAFFDIYPDNDDADFNGAWSNYPFFDSGVVIVSGREQGLYILGPNLPTGEPPSLISLAPGQDAPVSGTEPITIEATDVEDDPSDLTVEWRVDAGTWQTAAYYQAGNNWTASWDTTAVANGARILYARVTDLAGHTDQVAHNVTVDNPVVDGAPTNVAITEPADGSTVSGNLKIKTTAEDDVGVTEVKFFARIQGGAAKSLGVDTDGSNGWSTRWNTNKETNGDYALWVVATDTASQSTQSDTTTVTAGSGGESGPAGGKKCHPKKDPDCTR